jgi:hypothetical protein
VLQAQWEGGIARVPLTIAARRSPPRSHITKPLSLLTKPLPPLPLVSAPSPLVCLTLLSHLYTSEVLELLVRVKTDIFQLNHVPFGAGLLLLSVANGVRNRCRFSGGIDGHCETVGKQCDFLGDLVGQ